MTQPKANVGVIDSIHPHQIYRMTMHEQIFGYGRQRIAELIKEGKLPTPMPLSAGGRSLAWTGQQILDHRARMAALADERAKATASRPPAPQPKAFVKKLKLRRGPAPVQRNQQRGV
jgi:predicted DNA-binding transcriptional regulator AlpA